MFYKRYARTLGHMRTVPSIWMKNTKSARFTFTKRSSMDSSFLFSSSILAMAMESLGHICTLSSVPLPPHLLGPISSRLDSGSGICTRTRRRNPSYPTPHALIPPDLLDANQGNGHKTEAAHSWRTLLWPGS